MIGGVVPSDFVVASRSGRAQHECWLPASYELRQPFQVLSGGRQLKLLRHVPEPSQPEPAQSEPLLKLGKQGLDLVAVALRARIGRRAGQGTDRLARGLLPMHEESPNVARGAALFLGTSATLCRRGAVDVALRGRVRAAIPKRLALGTVVRVLARRIAKLVPGEPLACLVAPINYRDMRLDALPEKPGHKLAAAIGFVGAQTIRAQAQVFNPLEHPASGQRFLPKARRGGRHIENDAAGIVDQIVVVVREAGAAPLDGPRGVRDPSRT